MGQTSVFLRIDFAENARLGPGKIALLEAIERTGSISQAARELGMGYRTAWLLIESLNNMFAKPLVTTSPGRREGGSAVTDNGKQIIAAFRRVEALAETAIKVEVASIRRRLK